MTSLDTDYNESERAMSHGGINRFCRSTEGCMVLPRASVGAYLPRSNAAPPCAGERHPLGFRGSNK